MTGQIARGQFTYGQFNHEQFAQRTIRPKILFFRKNLIIHGLTAKKYTSLCADDFQLNARNELVWDL